MLFARAPIDASFTLDVLPAMILLGFGAGMVFKTTLRLRHTYRVIGVHVG